MTDHIATTPADGDAVREILHNAHSLAAPIEVRYNDPDLPAALLQIIPPGYGVQTVDLSKYRGRPTRKSGSVSLRDAASFVDYVLTHAEIGTSIYADQDSAQVTAILNADTSHDPGWSDHRAVLSLRFTPEWKRWAGANGKWQTQEQFAEFVEESSPDFRKPAAATMLEIAQTFEAKSGVEFQSGSRLDNGERQLVYKETVTAKAGQSGHLEVPSEVEVALRPYEGGKGYFVKARLRYRINNGTLSLMVKIDRIHDLLETAFAETITGLRDSLESIPDLLVVHGTRH